MGRYFRAGNGIKQYCRREADAHAPVLRQKPFVSIIMPALNEELHIREAVTSVLPDTSVVDYEVIVADGGSTDRTCNIVNEITAANPCVRLLHNPKRIQSAGVNLGAQAADPRATYMLRADCHFEYPKGFAERCIATLVEHNVASVVVPMRTVGSACLQEAFAAAQNSRLGNGGSAHRCGERSGIVEHGHHAAFRRGVFLKLGGYDESFTHNEDAEFDKRLVMSGERIYLNSDLPVTYYPRSSFISLARQYWWHGWGRAGTMIKHAAIPRLRQVLPPVVLIACSVAVLLSLLDARFLIISAAYVAACIAWGIALAVKNRQPCLVISGVAAIVMHMSWASGFLTKVWRSRRDVLAWWRRDAAPVLARAAPLATTAPRGLDADYDERTGQQSEGRLHMTSAPGVCVIIAAFNAERTIARAIRSVLAEGPVTEVIVCDDASRDATVAIARACDDGTGRLSVISLPSNMGPGAARNVALYASRAPLVCLLDADDYMLPGRISRLLATAGEDWDFLADDIVIVPEALDSEPIELPLERSIVTVRLADFVRSNISRPGRPRAELGFMKPIMRREFLDRNKLRYDGNLRLGEDYALYVEALVAGAVFKVAGACGYVAVERSTSISSSHSSADLKRMADFDRASLASTAALSADERDALREHLRATLNKYCYRVVLDTKRDGGMLKALRVLLGMPTAWPHILAETLKAKLQLYAPRISRQFIGRHGSKIRYLIGPPLTQSSA